jgi:hypothetical protein
MSSSGCRRIAPTTIRAGDAVPCATLAELAAKDASSISRDAAAILGDEGTSGVVAPNASNGPTCSTIPARCGGGAGVMMASEAADPTTQPSPCALKSGTRIAAPPQSSSSAATRRIFAVPALADAV